MDKVTIKSANADEPLTLLSVRLDAEDLSQEKVQRLCSMLGFLNPEKSFYQSVKSKYFIEVSTEITGDSDGTNGLGKKMIIPALHINAVETEFSSLFFTHIPKMGSHYLSTPTRSEFSDENGETYFQEYEEKIETKSYISEISCYGITDIHRDNDGNLNKENFLEGIFEAQLGKALPETPTPYELDKPFLVKKADNSWEFETYNGGRDLNYKKDKNLIALADQGAKEICIQSGYNSFLFYNFKYLKSNEAPAKVYEFVNGAGWNITSRPTKVELEYEKSESYVGTTKVKVEVPATYLDDVYCY